MNRLAPARNFPGCREAIRKKALYNDALRDCDVP
jgi:hypothetical protein